MGKRQNRRKHHTQYHTIEPRGQPFPAGDHQAVRYDKDKHETQITKMIHKTSTALEQSVRKFLEGLNIFTVLILPLFLMWIKIHMGK